MCTIKAIPVILRNRVFWLSVPLVRFNDESEGEDYSFYSDDSMDQETSQSLIPHSQTRVSDSSIAESSQSIIPHSEEQGLRLTEVNPGKGDVVEIHMRKGRNGRLYTSRGRVMQVDPDQRRIHVAKNFVKFWRLLHVIRRLWVQMIHNRNQNTRFRSTTDYFYCIVVEETKIFFNLKCNLK